MVVTPIGWQGINLTWNNAIAIADKLRMEVYDDPSNNLRYICYTLPEKAKADFAWSIERLTLDPVSWDIIARHYAMTGWETSLMFRFQAIDLANVTALPYNDA